MINYHLIKKRKDSKPSIGEKIVIAYLRKAKIKFKREHFFPDLTNDETGNLLFFDFYIRNLNLVIEVDGEQHFTPINGHDKFMSQKHRDEIKDIYCIERNIKMLRLSYADLRHPFPALSDCLGRCVKIKVHRQGSKRDRQLKKRFKQKKVRTRPTKEQLRQKKVGNRIKKKQDEWMESVIKKREEGRKNYPKDIQELIAKKEQNEKRVA